MPFSKCCGKNQGLSDACSKIKNLKALGWLAIVFWLPLDIIVLFWMRWEILSVVRSLTKMLLYLPGTAEEQASAQGKRERIQISVVSKWKKTQTLQPSLPFPPQLSPWLQGNHLPFYPSQGIASGQGKFKCGWGTCGANTSPLRSHTKSSTDFGVGCCGFAPLEFWAPAWECKKLFEMALCFFPPEFISSSSIWWQCCHGSVGLSLITNSLESPLVPDPLMHCQRKCRLCSSLWLQVIWYFKLNSASVNDLIFIAILIPVLSLSQ